MVAARIRARECLFVGGKAQDVLTPSRMAGRCPHSPGLCPSPLGSSGQGVLMGDLASRPGCTPSIGPVHLRRPHPGATSGWRGH